MYKKYIMQFCIYVSNIFFYLPQKYITIISLKLIAFYFSLYIGCLP